MKIIAAVDELPICASKMEPEETIRRRISSLLKNISHVDKASKIPIEFGEKERGDIQLFAKPHFMSPDMLDDSEMFFVGIPGFYDPEAFSNEEERKIEESMKCYRCYPVFQKKVEYSRMIERILKKNTYEFVQKNLDHSRMFEEYKEYNTRYYEKIMEVYEDGDVVLVMDHSLLLLPGMLGLVPTGMSFCIPFSPLVKCIPFCEEIFRSIFSCKYIEFADSSSKDSFDLLASQKIGFPMGNPGYENSKAPETCVGKRGIDKNAILKASFEVQKLSGLGNGEVILVPFDSCTHLLGIEAYLSRYGKEVTILFLITKALGKNFDEQTEVMRLREYLEINYRVQTKMLVPTNDSEFVSALKACDLCHCPEMEGFCSLLGIPIVSRNPYDFFDVADEINEKLSRRSGRENPGQVIGKMEWKKHFMTNFLDACGIEYEVDLETREPSTRFSLSMEKKKCENADVKRTLVKRRKEEKKETVQINLDDKEDTNVARIVDDFKKSKTRTLIMDYDGTLTDIVAHPPMATPTQEIRDMLIKLSKICRVVISTGRSLEDSEKFFPKEIEVFAEHGACHRINGEWKEGPSFPQKDLTWKIGEFFHLRTPGSEIEMKRTGYTFHFRNVPSLVGVKQAKALFELLMRICKGNVTEGNYLIEVRSCKKYDVIKKVEKEAGDGFILCAGDDIADEEMFGLCKGYTVKIGDKNTSAAYRIKDPRSFRALLQKFLE
ncbi:trehalose-6-phosphatase [Encephalitozoon intestinalis ATCC 50506]|uniref:Trehalose-6-phosphatase n=1 Tax=Encephalitozoon intestinalis (strain ATCC 50506) TaxID=876142 RepID=E0S5F4_ENCIT|nr:trehalose-6-phosphatase [Encephalitozoon intestinalis ATCC 50506]ADM10939.1 trehalose-6-phosphatase [Encephalitozoon intestinalis ATCC 50506]UTX44574.1 trehalose-6-phosphatase [Encephalitozoon intestinalis]